MDDPYKILGVARSASAAAIKTAYRALAKRHHPDVNKGGAARFRAINEAYQVLADAEKRAQYDLADELINPLDAAATWPQTFSEVFGDWRRQAAAQERLKSQADEITAVGDDVLDWRLQHFETLTPAERAQVRQWAKAAQDDWLEFMGIGVDGAPRQAEAWQRHLQRKQDVEAMKKSYAKRQAAAAAKARHQQAERRRQAARKGVETRKYRETLRRAEAEVERLAKEAEAQEAMPLRTVWRKCGSPGCHCAKPDGTLHGPYRYRYGKSRRVNGKVVTDYGGKPTPRKR